MGRTAAVLLMTSKYSKNYIKNQFLYKFLTVINGTRQLKQPLCMVAVCMVVVCPFASLHKAWILAT